MRGWFQKNCWKVIIIMIAVMTGIGGMWVYGQYEAFFRNRSLVISKKLLLDRMKNELRQVSLSNQQKDAICANEKFLNDFALITYPMVDEWWSEDEDVALALKVQDVSKHYMQEVEKHNVQISSNNAATFLKLDKLCAESVATVQFSRNQIVMVTAFLLERLMNSKLLSILEWDQSYKEGAVIYECRFEAVTNQVREWMNLLTQSPFPVIFEEVQVKRRASNVDYMSDKKEFKITLILKETPLYALRKKIYNQAQLNNIKSEHT